MTARSSESIVEAAQRVYGVPAVLARAIAWFPVVSALILGAMLAIPVTYPRAAGMLKEDRLVENLTFVAYFVAAAQGAWWVVRRMQRHANVRVTLFVLAVAVVCFGFGGEEISWGQRWLHFSLHALTDVNVQHESNVHNLEAFQDLGSWYPLVIAVAAAIAILFHTRPRRDATGVPSLVWQYVWVTIVLSGYDNLTYSVPINLKVDSIVGMLSELVEMLVSFGFVLALWLAMRRESRAAPAGGAG